MLNGGRPVANSIPATEHSVMTAWPTEQAAIENMIDHFGTGIFACVMDSYDYARVRGRGARGLPVAATFGCPFWRTRQTLLQALQCFLGCWVIARLQFVHQPMRRVLKRLGAAA